MADDRTPEQRSADEALRAAVMATVEAYGMQDQGEIVLGFMVLCSVVGVNDDADDTSGVLKLLSDGSMRWQDQFGLLRMADLNLRRQYNQAYGDE